MIVIQRVAVGSGADICFQVKLQGCNSLQNPLGLRGVLHAGQLHNQSIDTLALHNRLGNTQRVNTTQNGCLVGCNRVFLHLCNAFRRHGQYQNVLIITLTFLYQQIDITFPDQGTRLCS